MNKEELVKRDSSLDIVRIFALFCVISVHSFLNSGFYKLQTVATVPHFLLVTIRSFLMICVPLFIVLTGYLVNKKTLSKKYYKGIVKILLIYFLASTVNVIYQLIRGAKLTFSDIFFGFLSFKNAPYSWYIEMYIGLFLLIPFLNLIYNNLKNKKQKQVLIFTLIFLTALPSIFNIWDFKTENWFANPSISSTYQKLIPAWWVKIYPFTYYFIGCYLSEFKVEIKKRYLLILLTLQTLFAGGFNFYRSFGTKFIQEYWANYWSIFTVITTVLVFLLITNIDTHKWNLKLKAFIKYFSSLTLCTYLVSSVFDNLFYEKLAIAVPVIKNRMIYLPLMIIIVFLSSSALSAVVNLICSGIMKLPQLFKKGVKKVDE